MITLLDGTRLPSHGELYKIWDKIFTPEFIGRFVESYYVSIGVNAIRETLNLSKDYPLGKVCQAIAECLKDCSYGTWSYQMEYGNWDIRIYNKKNDDRYNIEKLKEYLIEYKSNIDEWGKGIDDFLRQINGRPKTNKQDEIYLLTFDKRFEEYRKILAANKIWLLILDQDILKNGN